MFQEREDFARASIPIAPAELGDVELAQLEGTVETSVFQFRNPPELDALMARARVAHLENGYLVLLDCTARVCGGFDFRQAIQTLPPPVMVVDLGQFGYLAARHPDDAKVSALLLSTAGDLGYAQLVQITPVSAPPDSPNEGEPQPVALPTSAPDLQSPFGAQGSIVLEGLIFETGSAALSDEDYPGLRMLSEFLNANPDARVTLVGHTDAEGSLATNIALSRQRAEAVRVRMIEGFGVPAEQLAADGVGYLAPRATNSTQEGRLLNRRVEAVLVQP